MHKAESWGGGEGTARPGLGTEPAGLLAGCRGPFPSPAAAQASASSAGPPNPRRPGGSVQAASLKIARSPHPLPPLPAPSGRCVLVSLSPAPSVGFHLSLPRPLSVSVSLSASLTHLTLEGRAWAFWQPQPGRLASPPSACSLGSCLSSRPDASDCLHQFYGASMHAFRWTGLGTDGIITEGASSQHGWHQGAPGAGIQRGAACSGHPRKPAHGAWGSREPRPTICRSGA